MPMEPNLSQLAPFQLLRIQVTRSRLLALWPQLQPSVSPAARSLLRPTHTSTHTISANYPGDTAHSSSSDTGKALTINAATLTVTFTAADKTYDGNTTAAVSNCAIATGKVGTDDVTCTVASGTFASSSEG
jgi:hypothetical protein